MTAPTPPADAVVLDDPGNLAGTYSAALVADVKAALDVWTTHLSGLGTLTVSLMLSNPGQTGLLADGGPTEYRITGAPTPDGHTLAQPGSLYELITGQHLSGTTSDITIDVNAAYLSQLYLGGGSGVPSGEYDGLSLFEHEITHGLGFGGFTSQTGTIGGGYETAWDRDLADIGGTEVFTGANARAANGGSYVDVTTLNNGEGYAHLANSSSDPNANDLMTGLGLPTGVQRGISNVDLAILADIGAPVTGMAGTVTIAGTTTLSAVTGQAVSLGGVTLADTGMFATGAGGSSLVTLTASDTSGLLGATNAGASLGATATLSSGGHTLTLTGSLAAVQADLATMTYAATLAGPDTISLSVVDSYGNTGSGSVAATATPGANYAAPVLSAITASASASGTDGLNTVRAGAILTYTLTTSGPVTLAPGATLGLTLGDHGTATYDAAASTPTSLVFTSTVLHDQFGVANVTGIVQSPGALTNVNGGPVTLSTFGVSQPSVPGSGTPFVDATGPIAPGFALAVNDNHGSYLRNVSNTATPVLAGVASAGDTVVVSDTFGGTTSVIGTATADSFTGLWTLPVTTPLADGVHSLTGVATDAVKGVSDVSLPVLVTIDTVAPAAPTLVLAAASGGVTHIAAAVLTGTAEAGDTLSIFDDGVLVGVSQAAPNGAWTATLNRSPLVPGANALTASAMDEAGNVSPLSAALDVTLAAPSPGTGTAAAPPASPPAAPVLPFTLDGVQAGAPAYAADAGSHYAVVNAGTVSIVANASASGTMTVYGNGGSVDFTNGGGSGLVVGTGLSSLAMTGGTAGSTLLAFTGTGATSYTGGSGTDEVISGGGAMSLTGGTGGSLLVFGGAGTLNLVGNGESDMIIGGAGAETVHAGTGAVFGGSGGSLLFANGAGTFLAGNVDGDQLSASSLGGDILAGGAGNETLAGAGSANGDLIFAGTGSDLVSLGLGPDTFAGGTGSDTIQAGTGNATLYLGSGAPSLISFTAGSTGGTDTLSGFRVGTDHLSLDGYAGPAKATTAGGNTTLALTDGTRIILQGVTTGQVTSLTG